MNGVAHSTCSYVALECVIYEGMLLAIRCYRADRVNYHAIFYSYGLTVGRCWTSLTRPKVPVPSVRSCDRHRKTKLIHTTL